MNDNKMPNFEIGKRIESNGLTVFPLYLEQELETSVKSGLTMIDEGFVKVKEVSDAGRVPTLYVINDCEDQVLFVEGDQLVGAKQNRICNSSVLIASKSFAEIPVSCVEQGRWARKSSAFASSNNSATPQMRKILKESKRKARKEFIVQQDPAQLEDPASVVHEHAAVHKASQGDVWDKVEAMQFMHVSPSHTSSMEDVFNSKSEYIERAMHTFKYPKGAQGWIIAINGEIETIEMFGKKSLCENVWDRVMRGCVLETLGKVGQRHRGKKGTMPKIERVKEQQVFKACGRLRKLAWERVAAVSAGEEYRGDDGSLIGSQLQIDGQLVHLSAVI